MDATPAQATKAVSSSSIRERPQRLLSRRGTAICGAARTAEPLADDPTASRKPAAAPRGTVHHVAVCPTTRSAPCVGGNEVFRSTDKAITWTSVLAVPTVWHYACRLGMEKRPCYAAYSTGLVFRSMQAGRRKHVERAVYGRATSRVRRDHRHRSAIRELGRRRPDRPGGAERRRPRPRRGPERTSYRVPVPDRSCLRRPLLAAARVYNAHGRQSALGERERQRRGCIAEIPINALVIDMHLSDTGTVATDIGRVPTRDGGDNWQPFNDGLPRIVVSGLVALRAKTTRFTPAPSAVGRTSPAARISYVGDGEM